MSLTVLEPSLRSLPTTARLSGSELCNATAFVARHRGEHYLVTNWHVATGRNPETRECLLQSGAVPDELSVLHHVAGNLGSWHPRVEPLYDAEDEPLWYEHPTLGRQVDVVALPLTQTEGVDLYPYEPENPGPTITYGPSESLSIIGFPFGHSAGGGLGIWVPGSVASEPEIGYLGLPCFLVDAATRAGQSGSPVILYRKTGYSDEDGNVHLATNPAERFVGVYSGRIAAESDIGRVWKVQALTAILDAKQRGPRLS